MPSSQSNELSLYVDEKATTDEVKEELSKLSVSFPEIDNNFIIILSDRLKTNGFTKQRLHDAISHVIDTCHYPRPSIAEIISFDRKVKTYTYTEMIALCTPFKTTENFEMIQVGNKKRWIEK